MRYLIILLWCLFTTSAFSKEKEPTEEFFPSTPEQIASLSSEPSYLIGGLISPLSGQPVLRETDLVVKGAQDIVLGRVYIAPYIPCSFGTYKRSQEDHDKDNLYAHLEKHYKGWRCFPHLKAFCFLPTNGVLLTEPSGITLYFHVSGSNTTLASTGGLNNTAGDIPSGKYDPRNTKITFEEERNTIIVHASDGTIRTYRRKGFVTRYEFQYFLEKEILPNGKVLKYHYDKDKGHLACIEALSPHERFVYASLRLEGLPVNTSRFLSPSGINVDYAYQVRSVDIRIKEHKGERRTTRSSPSILTSVSSPYYRHETSSYNDKFLLTSFSGQYDTFQVQYIGVGDPSHYKVNKLLLPVGQKDAYEPVYEFAYTPGSTTVKNRDGTSIVYHFSNKLLLTSIQYFGQDKELKKEKTYTWDDHQWLTSTEIRDAQKKRLYRKSYTYDRFGNPISETFTGDVTGNGQEESITIKRVFSDDGRHLLLKEEHEDGKTICFSYLPKTNLVTAKLTKDKDKILLREFSTYDSCHNLIQTLSDDGVSEDKNDVSQVMQRRITTYTLRQTAPFLHMPEWVEETYLEAGVVKLLQKRHLVYDAHGNVAQEEVYDTSGNHAYTICRTYNERGDILTETNRLGQQAMHTYDAKGSPETSVNFSHRQRTTWQHDTQGRVKARTQKGDDGVVHAVFMEYDLYDRKTQETDHYHNATQFHYDPLVNEVAQTDYPSIVSIDGKEVPVSTSATYDPFGRALTKTDANGNTTAYRYNAYGSPIEMIHPSGGRETFTYAKNGQLRSYTDQDGLTIVYERDVLGRVLSKTYTYEGITIAQELFTYSGFNLLSETDKEGHVKRYVYDGAGRKVREAFCGHVTDFSYDALGRLSTLCKHNGDNSLFIHYTRDLEGRALEESKTDADGTLLYRINYSYDADGNIATTTRHINEKEAVDTFAYDSFQRITEKKDATGHVFTTLYDEQHTNALGQRVLQTITADPKGISTLETSDALFRTVSQEILDADKDTIACQEMTHDAAGNLLFQRDHIYEHGHYRNTQTIKYVYTQENRIASFTKAYGTKEARTTAYTHSPTGQIATKTLPDGITLTYSYHPLGYMSRLDSSDGQIHHVFEYNLLGHLTTALDEKHNSAIVRNVDPFGNVLQERFPYVTMEKEYDAFSRLTSLCMGNHGEVHYAYDPLFLRQVIRRSFAGDTLYKHDYEEYDENGHLVTQKLIGNLGTIVHTLDLRGYKTAISCPYFTQQCSYDSVGNLISAVTDEGLSQYAYDDLSQLSSERNASEAFAYAHDSMYNRVQKNEEHHIVNDLNEYVSDAYDLNGNLIKLATLEETFHLSYDPLNRLTEACSEKHKMHFTYDPLGRRLSKVVLAKEENGWKGVDSEQYLYDGNNEIGAVSLRDEIKNLRVLGLARHKDSPETVGVELGGRVFAPILDVQGNIRRLIDLETREVADRADFTAFGEEVKRSTEDGICNPWGFASKRYDSELGLIYFGKRYYEPLLGRWLTIDPAGFVDSVNLYQYAFNNPFYYFDPDGQALGLLIPLVVWGVKAALPTLAAISIPKVAAFVTTAAIVLAATKVGTFNVSRETNAGYIDLDLMLVKSIDAENEKNQKNSEDSQENKQKNGTPKSNSAQNKQFNDAIKEIEKEIGQKLSKDEMAQLHREISGKNYNYHEIVEEGINLFGS